MTGNGYNFNGAGLFELTRSQTQWNGKMVDGNCHVPYGIGSATPYEDDVFAACGGRVDRVNVHSQANRMRAKNRKGPRREQRCDAPSAIPSRRARTRQRLDVERHREADLVGLGAPQRDDRGRSYEPHIREVIADAPREGYDDEGVCI